VSYRIFVGLLTLSFACPAVVSAQTPRGITPAPRRDTPIPLKRATATRTAEPPVIDGVLDERVWEQATPICDFVQAEPTQGEPATEQTDVRLIFDNKTLHRWWLRQRSVEDCLG
jgi:hypothetical protein